MVALIRYDVASLSVNDWFY